MGARFDEPEDPIDVTDDQLTQRWLEEGDEDAFATLFDRHRHGLTGYCAKMVGSSGVAEEICVEAFARVLDGSYDGRGSLKGFVYRVAHRMCIDRIRRRGVFDRVVERVPEPAPVERPDEIAHRGERLQRLQRAMDTLADHHRATLLLYYGQGLSSREVGEILECRPDQVRSRVAYACRLLRAELDVDRED